MPRSSTITTPSTKTHRRYRKSRRVRKIPWLIECMDAAIDYVEEQLEIDEEMEVIASDVKWFLSLW